MCGDGFSVVKTSEVQSWQDLNEEAYGCLLHCNVPDDQVLQFQILRISIRLCIFQKAGDEFDRLLGPTAYYKV
jgi:hypothetical protein